MKKAIIATILLSLFALCSCGKTEGQSYTSEPEEICSPERYDSSPNIEIEDFYVTCTGYTLNLYYIDEDNVLWGSGYNNYGQLGQGTQDDEYYEDLVRIWDHVVHVDYSQRGFTIFLTEDHKLYGMGASYSGALLNKESISIDQFYAQEEDVVTSPVLLMENVVYACCGHEDVVCMTESGDVYVWGLIWNDEMYRNSYCFEPQPVLVLANAVLVTGGYYSHAALLNDGTVWTWGYNYAGNCGVSGENYISEPVKVAEDAVMVWTGRVNMNESHQDIADYESDNHQGLENTIILKSDGSVQACGAIQGAEKKTLASYCAAIDYPLECTSEFVTLSDTYEINIPESSFNDNDNQKNMENTAETLSPMEAWEILRENSFPMYASAGATTEAGDELSVILSQDTGYTADGDELYHVEYKVIYRGIQDGKYVFAQYYFFSGSNYEKYYLPCRNWYYIDMSTGAITMLAK